MLTPTTRTKRAPDGVDSGKPIYVRLTPEERSRVEKAAARQQRSMGSLLRLAALRSLPIFEQDSPAT